MEKQTKLIVNADDYGFSDSVSRGIIKAYKEGIVTSTTMMANLPTAESAAKYALENPGLAVGIHFVLTAGYPISSGVSSLIDLDGKFPKSNVFFDKLDTGIDAKFDTNIGAKVNVDEKEVEKEFRAQLERFLSFGLTPSHFDSHHHVHLTEAVRPVVEKLAKEYNVPVRCFDSNSGAQKEAAHFIDGFFDETSTLEHLTQLLKESKDHKIAELMCHPGFVDDNLRSIDSYCDKREVELEILTSDELKKQIEELNIELISYRDIV